MEKGLSKNIVSNIIDNGANGSGIAKVDGAVCFVPLTIQGEKVSFDVVSHEKNYCLCKLGSVIEKSENRTLPFCKYFGMCGGCQLQHMKNQFQLDFKTKQVKTILEKTLKVDVPVLPCKKENEYAYRNKVNFAICNNKLCFAKADGSFFEVESCPLFKTDLSEIIKAVNKYLSSAKPNVVAFHIRNLNGKYQFTFVSKEDELEHKELIISLLNELSISFSLFLSTNKIANSSNITENVKCLFGNDKLDYEILGIKSKISPGSFLQVNEKVQNEIYTQINSQIPSESKVINAYGGTGILSSIMAKCASFVYSVEINKAASANCSEMLKENNITNVRAICGDCKVEIPKILKTENISHIVFDPPRSGINSSILNTVAALKIPNLIYLSCNPSTLARDLKLLCSSYEIKFVQPFDMFPQTSHVETLVSLKIRSWNWVLFVV